MGQVDEKILYHKWFAIHNEPRSGELCIGAILLPTNAGQIKWTTSAEGTSEFIYLTAWVGKSIAIINFFVSLTISEISKF